MVRRPTNRTVGGEFCNENRTGHFGSLFSPIEVYISLKDAENENENLIAYLKSETDTLDI